MIVLLTNDDGIFAEGLGALCRAFESCSGWEVYIAAPDRERSASGHAITMHQPLRVDEVKLEGTCSRVAWAVSGTPADCTKLAVKALLPGLPRVVVSGINRGPNLGADVFYSGTVSAAFEAAMLGIPAIAVSMAAFENLDYALASEFAVYVAGLIEERGLPRDTILNINVPALPPCDIAGVAVTRLGTSRFRDFFERRLDPRGRAYYWLTGEMETSLDGPDTDVGAIKANLISLTPVQLDLTHHGLVGSLPDWHLKIPHLKRERLANTGAGTSETKV
jgi:5'-nucleotidase